MTPNTPSEPMISCRRSGPAADCGARPRSSTPAGVIDPQSADHVVEPAVARRVLARRAGRREAADAWRTRSSAGSVRAKSRARQAVSRPRGPVTPAPNSASPETSSKDVQLVEAAQVQRHRRGEVAADRVESADHAGAAAEGDDGDAVLARSTAGSRRSRRQRRAAAPRRERPGRRSPCAATGPGWTCRLRAAAGRWSSTRQ